MTLLHLSAASCLLLGSLSGHGVPLAQGAEARAELPSVRLPVATTGGEQASAEGAVLSVLADGKVLADSGLLYDPLAPDERPLLAWLADTAKRMPKKALPSAPDFRLADQPLLLRADAMTDFGHLLRIMNHCGSRDVAIWKLEFATLAKGDEEGAAFAATTERGLSLAVPLPLDAHEVAVTSKEVQLRVVQPGEKVTHPDGSFTFDGTRKLAYVVAHRELADLLEVEKRIATQKSLGTVELSIEAMEGVTHGEVVRVVAAARRAGFERITFVGRP